MPASISEEMESLSKIKDSAQNSLLRQRVKIGRAELVGGNFRKHIKYTVELDSRDPVERRYSDFLWMRNQLQKLFPCVFIPPIPPKKAMALWPVGYLDFRRRELERFLNRLVERPFVCASKPFLVFMCRPSNQLAEGQKVAEAEVARMARAWEAQTMRLKEAFPEVFSRKSSSDIVNHIDGTREYLQKMHSRMKTMLSVGEKLHATTAKVAQLAKDFSGAIDAARADEIYLPPPFKESKRREQLGGSGQEQEAHDRSQILDIADVYSRTCFPSLDLFGPRLLSGIRDELGDIEAFLDLFSRWEDIGSLSRKAAQDAAQWHNPHGSTKSQDRKITDLRTETELRAFFLTCTQLLQAQFAAMWDHNSRRHHSNATKFANSQASHHEKSATIWKESLLSISIKECQGESQSQGDQTKSDPHEGDHTESEPHEGDHAAAEDDTSTAHPPEQPFSSDKDDAWTPVLAGIAEQRPPGASPQPIPMLADSMASSRDSGVFPVLGGGGAAYGRAVSITPRSADLEYFNPLTRSSPESRLRGEQDGGAGHDMGTFSEHGEHDLAGTFSEHSEHDLASESFPPRAVSALG